jgi:hypothetical protein
MSARPWPSAGTSPKTSARPSPSTTPRGGGPAARGLIHYADAIAKALDLDGAEDTQLPHLDPATIDALDLDQHTLARVLAETQEGFDHCSLLLG